LEFVIHTMAVTNLVGNGLATIVVGTWCGQVDELRLSERLANGRR
jgi:aerobic C4-dicarboxylate transport protein